MREAPTVSTPQRPLAVAFLICLALAGPVAAQRPAPKAAETKSAPAEKKTDALSRIREEGMERSQVMATLSHLTDVIGPRLTGSPGLRRANEWTRDKFTSWGLVNARLEPWGPFGRGWELKRFSAQVVSPQAIPLIAYPKAWSPGLGVQPFEAEVVHVDIKKSEDLEKFRGKLRGKIVLDGSVQELKMNFEPLAKRRTETQLLALANSDGTAAPRTSSTVAQAAAGIATNPLASPEQRAALAFTPRRYQFFSEEGVAVLLQPSRTGEAGNLFTAGATVYPPRSAETAKAESNATPSEKKKKGDATAKKSAPATTTTTNRGISPWKIDAPPIVPQLTLAAEHYNRLVRMTQAGEKLRVAVELQAEYLNADLMAANTVAEIPGSDLAHEIVMLGAHLDSWHSATGATDNAAGCSVVMEAVRILQALELKPRRTIRIALWTGEEQGLLGSKAYVAEHFGVAKNAPTSGASSPPRDESDPSTFTARTTVPEVEKKPEHDRLSAYFNLDNGGGKIRGIYLQNNEAVRPLFRQWLKPFKDLGAETTSLANTSGTDHLSFDNVGLPGFQFIQDEIEYGTRTHHGNMDLYDRIVADDLKQASVIMATFVYQAAMLDEKLPRKPFRTAPAAGTTTAASGTQ